jgi:tetratricopeptide (TPR) repeat protein
MRSRRKAGKAVSIVKLAAGLLATILLLGCAGSGSVRSASGTRVSAQALAEASEKVRTRGIPEPLQADFTRLYSEGRQNSVLHAMRAGLRALRLGYDDLAREVLDQAIAEVEALQEGTRQAKRAKSRFVGEREKWFKGENYERSALYFYRGLLYLKEQDFNNAAACFKRAQVEDITGDDAADFAGDWLSAEWALALASLKAGRAEDAAAARRRAEGFARSVEGIVWPEADVDTLVVVEAGQAPLKYRAGKFGEQLKFAERPSPVARVEVAGVQQPMLESLYHQATTRGTRQVDYILGEKASFKEDTGNAALGLGVAAVAAAHTRTQEGAIAAGVLGLAALGTAIASSATQPEADIRAWDILPEGIFLVGVRAEGRALEVRGLDSQGKVVNQASVAAVGQEKGAQELRVVFIRFTD